MEPLRDLESEGHEEMHTVAFKVNDLEFQGHVIKIENSNYHLWIPWPRNYTHEKFHVEIRSERLKSRGGGLQTPPLAANVNWNSLAVRELRTVYIEIDGHHWEPADRFGGARAAR